MVKKGKGKCVLGRALVKDRFGHSRRKRTSGETSMLHTADIDDGYQWDRLNLKSITEESSLQNFLSTAQLAGTEFHAEKLNIKFVNPKSCIGVLSETEKEEMLETHRRNKDVLKIPRRPKWDESTSAAELQEREKNDFLEWRRNLSLIQEAKGLTMTPYEKTLEFWRQLWRVVERSDVVVQIVDARNPLLFRCEDLERYVKEVSAEKMNMILVNKADFLTSEQRRIWADYFAANGTMVAFFSATLSAEETMRERKNVAEESEGRAVASNDDGFLERGENDDTDEDEDDDDDDDNVEDENQSGIGSDSENEYSDAYEDAASESKYESADDGSDAANFSENESTDTNETIDNGPTKNFAECSENTATNATATNETKDNEATKNSPEILNREKLISLFKSMYDGKRHTEGITTVGLVGYPNVGKSSTINAILMDKKVSVSATPGKTKHFQTLFVDDELLLCDCPGLVMPSFVCTKAEMVLNGILPIDQLRDHVPSVTLVGTLIPRHIVEDTYGIMIPPPMEGEEPDRPPTAEEILNTYGYNRGFMTQNGQPDNPRAARYILKDFVNGKLLHCEAPPGHSQSEFHKFPPRRVATTSANKILPARAVRASRGVRTTGEDVDKLFFGHKSSGLHVRGVAANDRLINASLYGSTNGRDSSIAGSTQTLVREDKPWKKINKHGNKKKREKSRRLFAHLDQH